MTTTAKMDNCWYEFTSHADRDRRWATERVLEDLRAAAHLGISASVTECHFKAFRNGGNVTKANVTGFYVEFGEAAVAEGDPTLSKLARAAVSARGER